MAETILGIDLGTTFSTAAVVLDGRFHYAIDARGEACIPSVVYFPKSGPPVVGAEADKMRATEPFNTVVGIKRVIGRTIEAPPTRVFEASSAIRLKGAGTAEVSVQTPTGLIPASEVAGLIVRHLKERAEARFRKTITKCVMTVPVAAGMVVEQAMTRIGRMAGLEVLRVVPEPVAGALARGIAGANGSEGPSLVFDFGGGTLDVTVVKRSPLGFTVLNSAGDDCLGGNDFDVAFARWVGNAIWGTFAVDVTKDVVLFDRIQRQCELVKRALSSTDEARFLLPEALGVAGLRRSLDVPVKRMQLNAPWNELVQRAVTLTAQTVVDAKLKPSDLTKVMLIGGTSFVPQVREAVATTLGRAVDIEPDPQTTVARGAALLAAMPTLLAA